MPHTSELWFIVYRFTRSHAHLLTTDCEIHIFPTDYLIDAFIPFTYALAYSMVTSVLGKSSYINLVWITGMGAYPAYQP